MNLIRNVLWFCIIVIFESQASIFSFNVWTIGFDPFDAGFSGTASADQATLSITSVEITAGTHFAYFSVNASTASHTFTMSGIQNDWSEADLLASFSYGPKPYPVSQVALLMPLFQIFGCRREPHLSFQSFRKTFGWCWDAWDCLGWGIGLKEYKNEGKSHVRERLFLLGMLTGIQA